MSELQDFITNLIHHGLEHFRKYYGVYRGLVEDNQDPEQRGRILVMVPEVGHRVAPQIWVEPAFGGGTNRGVFNPPEIGDHVHVAFKKGDSGNPYVYWGGWFAQTDLQQEFKYSQAGFPERRGIVTRSGQTVIFDDEAGQEAIKIIWNEPSPADTAYQTDTTRKIAADRTLSKQATLNFNSSGILVMNSNGSFIELDADNKVIKIIDESGNVVTLDSTGINMIDNKGNFISLANGAATVATSGAISLTGSVCNISCGGVLLGNGATFSNVLGEALIAWLGSHVHASPLGPTGVPVVPPNPATMLSKTVKVKP